MEEILKEAAEARRRLEERLGGDLGAHLAERRYRLIEGICQEVVRREAMPPALSDRIDWVATHRWLGVPLFVGMMWAVFKLTFALSAPLCDWLARAQEWLSALLESRLPPGALRDLVVDGVIGGVGTVLSFVPIIFCLFLFLSLLEDSGYLARAAFVMDRVLYRLGLHGRAFIPMLLGFGCNIPGIMACRVIPEERDRVVTVLINPFMSCSARLPVYALIIGAFFPAHGGTILFGLYLLGIAVAIGSALLFRRTILAGPPSPFVMELPPYRLPTPRGVLLEVWRRGKGYLQKAGVVILGVCLAIWALSYFPRGGDLSTSYLARVGRALEPAMRPLELDWRATVALASGFLAKESVVGTLGVLYGVGEQEEALRNVVRAHYGPTAAMSMMIFVLLYVPCVASMAVMGREIGWRWALFSMGYTTAVAYLMALLAHWASLGSLLAAW